MKRREFLKLIGIAPVVPSVLVAKEKPQEYEYTGYTKTIEGSKSGYYPIGFTSEAVSKNGYVWIHLVSYPSYVE